MPSPGKSARTTNAVISSRENRWLKEFRVALRGGLPTESGAIGVEGVRLTEEALNSGCRIEAVLFSESGRRHHALLAPYLDRKEIAFPILYTTDRLFEGIADTEHPQGVAALVEPRKVSFDELLAPAKSAAPLLVVLAGPALPILLAQLASSNIRTLASSLRDSLDQPALAPWEINWCEPVALLVGNEGAGLPEEIERSADVRIRIPMSGGIESLNAAAAAAVLFYEAARQR